jgi:hypothetical protein
MRAAEINTMQVKVVNRLTISCPMSCFPSLIFGQYTDCRPKTCQTRVNKASGVHNAPDIVTRNV